MSHITRNSPDEPITIIPTVGMPATTNCFRDSHAATVARIFSPKRIGVIGCSSVVVGGPYPYGVQPEREFTPESLEEITRIGLTLEKEHAYTLRQNGRWVMAGCDMNSALSLTIGSRHEHYSFEH